LVDGNNGNGSDNNDSSSDNLGDEKAQDHNSTRSNRATKHDNGDGSGGNGSEKLCLIRLRNVVPRSVNTATATRTVTTPFAKLDEKAQDITQPVPTGIDILLKGLLKKRTDSYLDA
jgi:hypothetical protein